MDENTQQTFDVFTRNANLARQVKAGLINPFDPNGIRQAKIVKDASALSEEELEAELCKLNGPVSHFLDF